MFLISLRFKVCLVATSLRKYLQIQLMFLIKNSLQDPLHVGAYRTRDWSSTSRRL